VAKDAAKKPESAKKRKAYLSQSDVPSFSLVEALRVPRAIWENYGGDATAPLKVAAALDLQPSSSHFRMLAGAALAYGLVTGGPKAAEIELTPLGRRVLRPLAEGDDLAATREALLQPRVIKEFLGKYSGAPLPRPTIAHNVLEDMGVPRDKAAEVHDLILEGARSVGFITEIKGQAYIDLSGVKLPVSAAASSEDKTSVVHDVLPPASAEKPPLDPAAETLFASSTPPEKMRKVFITHGKNKKFIDPIRKLLQFGDLEAVVATDAQSVSQPVPDKVMESMRACGAAIIHVDAERTLLDPEGQQQIVLNPNVLIEIGAALALYGRRFILLVREGVQLPSNLQGLFEVRYAGDGLDADATIRLLEAINDIKKRNLPS
jgi:predicted nucleotide-binding protein